MIAGSRSIGIRLATYVFVFAWVVSLSASGFQYWRSKQEEIIRVGQLLDQLVIGSEIQMADLVWEEDSARASQVAESIYNTTDVSYIKVRSSNGTLASIGNPTPHTLSRTVALKLRHGIRTPTEFGEFVLGVDMDVIDARLGRNFQGILIRTALVLFLSIGFVMLLFHIMVARHLRQIGRFFAALTTETLHRPLELERAPPPPDGGDEFDALARGVARMQHTLANDIELRKRAEEDLRQLNEVLESTVAKRTAELSEKNHELELLSMTDRLTGLANRRQLDTLLEHEIARCERHGTEFSVIMLDIDDFKRVNDEHGHDVGDTVLIAVAEVLKENIRRLDVLGRWGGEEFLILCSDTPAEQATAVAEKLRRALAAHAIEPTGAKTASFGITAFRPGDSIRALTRRADAALYRAKEAGRNRVERD